MCGNLSVWQPWSVAEPAGDRSASARTAAQNCSCSRINSLFAVKHLAASPWGHHRYLTTHAACHQDRQEFSVETDQQGFVFAWFERSRTAHWEIIGIFQHCWNACLNRQSPWPCQGPVKKKFNQCRSRGLRERSGIRWRVNHPICRKATCQDRWTRQCRFQIPTCTQRCFRKLWHVQAHPSQFSGDFTIATWRCLHWPTVCRSYSRQRPILCSISAICPWRSSRPTRSGSEKPMWAKPIATCGRTNNAGSYGSPSITAGAPSGIIESSYTMWRWKSRDANWQEPRCQFRVPSNRRRRPVRSVQLSNEEPSPRPRPWWLNNKQSHPQCGTSRRTQSCSRFCRSPNLPAQSIRPWWPIPAILWKIGCYRWRTPWTGWSTTSNRMPPIRPPSSEPIWMPQCDRLAISRWFKCRMYIHQQWPLHSWKQPWKRPFPETFEQIHQRTFSSTTSAPSPEHEQFPKAWSAGSFLRPSESIDTSIPATGIQSWAIQSLAGRFADLLRPKSTVSKACEVSTQECVVFSNMRSLERVFMSQWKQIRGSLGWTAASQTASSGTSCLRSCDTKVSTTELMSHALGTTPGIHHAETTILAGSQILHVGSRYWPLRCRKSQGSQQRFAHQESPDHHVHVTKHDQRLVRTQMPWKSSTPSNWRPSEIPRSIYQQICLHRELSQKVCPKDCHYLGKGS